MKFIFNFGNVKLNIFSKRYKKEKYLDFFANCSNLSCFKVYLSCYKNISYSDERVERINLYNELVLYKMSNYSDVFYNQIEWEWDDLEFYVEYALLSDSEKIFSKTYNINNLCFSLSRKTWNDSVYFILIDRYIQLEQKDKLDDEDLYMGGNFDTIYEDLERIRNAGYTILYLSPIMESLGYHGYNQISLTKINDKFGGSYGLKKLVNKMKRMNIKLGLELVLNHLSVYSAEFIESLKHENKMFLLDDNGNYQKYRTNTDLVKINYTTENSFDVMKKVINILKEYDVKFIRLDSCDYINNYFVNILSNYCIDNDITVIGECWSNYSSFFNNYFVNGATNYKLFGFLKRLFIDKTMYVCEFECELVLALFDRGLSFNNSMLNFIDNHDVARISNYIDTETELLNILSFIFVYIGIPVVYYGTENFNLDIKYIKFNRRTFSCDINKIIESHIKKLNEMRKKFVDDIIFFESDGEVLRICRKTVNGKLTYIYNNTNNQILEQDIIVNGYKSIIIEQGERLVVYGENTNL